MPIINQVTAGGGTTPTGTIPITSNGTYNVTDYASADVQVSTTVPELYRVFRSNNGKLDNSITTPFLTLPNTITDIGDFCLGNAYRNTPSAVLSGAIDLSSLTAVSGMYACQYMFSNCTGITSINLSSLTTASGQSACEYMFSGCTGITSINLSSLTTISGQSACHYMFANCTGITSANLSSLTVIAATNACQYMFYDCTGITSINLSSLTTITSTRGCDSMFYGCTGITSVDLSSLTTISGSTACQSMFTNCTSLATVYIGGTTAIDFGGKTNVFTNMFLGCTQNIDVYAPAASQSAIEAMSGYPNFGGTGTVTWHWRS